MFPQGLIASHGCASARSIQIASFIPKPVEEQQRSFTRQTRIKFTVGPTSASSSHFRTSEIRTRRHSFVCSTRGRGISRARVLRVEFEPHVVDHQHQDKGVTAQESELKRILNKLKSSIGQGNLIPSQHFRISGLEEVNGMEGVWEHVFSGDGKFFDSFMGLYTAECSGFDGEKLWHMGGVGHVSSSDLDDREVTLLGAWMLSGFWLSDIARHDWLEITIPTVEEFDDVRLRLPYASFKVSFDQKEGDRTRFLLVRLKGGKVRAFVVLDSDGELLPERVVVMAMGKVEEWRMMHWMHVKEQEASLKVPATIERTHSNGMRQLCRLQQVDECDSAPSGHERTRWDDYTIYREPTSPRITPKIPRPSSISFNADLPSAIETLRSSSGHDLVRPRLDGQDLGWFILDTGASSLTIVTSAADKLEMDRIGQLKVTTADGDVGSVLRRGRSLNLGPVHIRNPLFVELEDSALQGAAGLLNVVGVIGFDIFQACVVEMGGRNRTLSFFPADSYKPTFDSSKISWIPLQMMAGVPFAELRFRPDWDSDEISGMFLVDTGANGTPLIFNARAVTSFALTREKLKLDGWLKGVGNTGTGRQVQQRSMATLQLGGMLLTNVEAMLVIAADSAGFGLELSEYSSGLLTAKILQSCEWVVFDYTRKRMGIVPHTPSNNGSLASVAEAEAA